MNDTDHNELIIIGETLDELDEDNLPRKKPLIIEDQYALDAQGRRRFHGAFTGGFSAGYFNSVDTRDGWKPNQFKSSRSKKAASICQRPEDFMDDEDTGEFGIASTGIRASNDFSSHSSRGTKRDRTDDENSGPIPGTPVLKDLLETITDTVGVRLLKKMGWKQGQGVGPRLTSTEKKIFRQKQKNKKIYGCFLPNREIETTECDSEVIIEDSEVDRGILFAPDDLEPFRCKPKNNYFGIGYRGLNEMSMLIPKIKPTDGQIFRMQDRNKKLSIRGQAFGVGAFEVDDDDIYKLDDMTRYDFALLPEQKRDKRWPNERNFELQQCNCLQGFVVADRQFEKKKLFGPPNISKNFQPIHVIKRSRFSAIIPEVDIASKSKRDIQCTSSEVNKKMIDDITIPSDIKDRDQAYKTLAPLIEQEQNSGRLSQCSITSSISTSVMEQQSVKKNVLAGCQDILLTPSWMEKLNTKCFVRGGIESTSKSPGLSSLNHELNSINFLDDAHNFGIDTGLSNSLQHSVKVYECPMDQSMHVEESTQSPEKNEVISEIFQSGPWKKPGGCRANDLKLTRPLIEQTVTLPCADTKKDCRNIINNPISEDFAMNEAKKKVYGRITRTIEVWRPVNAIYKGFNIAAPVVECVTPDAGKIKNQCLFHFINFCSETINTGRNFEETTDTISTNDQNKVYCTSRNPKFSSAHHPTKLFDTSKIISTESTDEPQSELVHKVICDRRLGHSCTSEITRDKYCEVVFGNDQNIKKMSNDGEINEKSCKSWPPLIQDNDKVETKHDLFREIFLSCSEPSESDNESTDDIQSSTIKSLLIGKPANEFNTQRNTSPARGIFAQLNVINQTTDVINDNKFMHQHSSYVDTNTSDIETRMTKNSNFSDIIICDTGSLSDTYGPALPINFRDTIAQTRLDADSSNKRASENSIDSKYNSSKKTSVWVEKSKIKKFKKTKKKQKRISKNKDRKHKHKSGRKNVQ